MGSDVKRVWNSLELDTEQRLKSVAHLVKEGKVVAAEDAVALLEGVIRPGDKVCIEGDNQKQADFLAECLCQVDPEKVYDLHMVQSVVSLSTHLDVFEKGVAKKLDYSFSGPQAGRLAEFVRDGKLQLGAIHTYLELFARYFGDLVPRVALVVGYQADKKGNLYTGFNTEETPMIAEAVAFKQGIVVAQVNEVVDELPRVDIPADWVDFVVEAPKPFYIEPLFTRDPNLITDVQVLMAMMALKGVYAEYGVQSLNHGIGFATAAIELLLPTYGEELDLKGKVCSYFALNPHPTLIPAIESGFVKSIHSFGGELGMEKYVQARSDVFFIGPDGTMRSNRANCQVAGLYAMDMFIGGTLQIDKYGNSSTATANRIAGFGGAPNMGCDAKGRRHSSGAWLKCGQEYTVQQGEIGPALTRGKKLVVQMVETFGEKMVPAFVEELDAFKLQENANLDIPPVMIYSDDLTHIITEEGIAYMNRCANLQEKMAAIRAVAGYTEIGLQEDANETKALREKGVVKTPQDLGIDVSKANRSMLAAKNVRDLVEWSGGLYNPPARFRNW